LRVGLRGWAVVDWEDAFRPARERVKGRVRRDPVQPVAKSASAVESAQRAPGAEQSILERVLGVVQRAQHAVAVGVELPAERFDETTERFLVPRARRFQQLALGHGRH
jgi:hypothetical protein